MKKTIVIGASTNPDRFSYKAVNALLDNGHTVVPVGLKRGYIRGVLIEDLRKKPAIEGVDTITLYINPKNQQEWYNYILDLKPKRIIFNPGTENNELKVLAQKKGIDVLENCTLVMLRRNSY